MKADYLFCPFCKKVTVVQVLPETILVKFPLQCNECGKIAIINFVDGKYLVEAQIKTIN